jgi:hypothetical protein
MRSASIPEVTVLTAWKTYQFRNVENRIKATRKIIDPI